MYLFQTLSCLSDIQMHLRVLKAVNDMLLDCNYFNSLNLMICFDFLIKYIKLERVYGLYFFFLSDN